MNLYREGKSINGIVQLTGLSRNTVRAYLLKSTEEIDHDAPQSDAALADVFYNQDVAACKSKRYHQLLAHFEGVERELSRLGVTRQLLWREYLKDHPDGYVYSQYCHHLQRFLRKKDVAMHLEYKPAEQIIVDFAGKKYNWVDIQTGERIGCEVFVATLPYSGLIFCLAVDGQKIQDFLDACNQMLHYVGGVTETILCDNLRTAVPRSVDMNLVLRTSVISLVSITGRPSPPPGRLRWHFFAVHEVL